MSVELFIVQYEVAEESEDFPGGIWSEPKQVHPDIEAAEAEIVAERAKERHYLSDPSTFRIVKVLGEVVHTDKPKEEDEE